jgi:glycosyltransferase involved in cell wall biosynthesis
VYKRRVEEFVAAESLDNRVSIRSDIAFADFPAIYQMAQCLVYPSIFEGFGIPILEALWSRTPVITSTGSCFAEAGGAESIYVDPHNDEELAAAIERVLSDQILRSRIIAAGFEHAQNFTTDKLAGQMMALYRLLVA